MLATQSGPIYNYVIVLYKSNYDRIF